MHIPLIKKKFINFKSTFTKLILSYILLSFMILNISTFTLYQGYKNQITDESINVYDKLLRQANYYTQNTLSWAKTFVYQLYLDDNIYNLMYNTQKNSDNEAIGLLKVRQASSVTPLTQSIYVYNNNLKLFYSSSGVTAAPKEFYDQEIVSILKQSNGSFTSNFIARKIHAPDKNSEVNVLTIILANVKVSDNTLPEGAIILNLNADQIGNYFKDISDMDNDLFAINSNGIIILNSNTGAFYQNLSDKKYIKEILNSKLLQNHFLETINGNSYIVSYRSSELLNLKFIDITPYQTMLGSMQKMLKLLIIIFIVLFFLGVLFSYILSRTIYSPIARVVKHVKKNFSSNDPTDKNKNELDYLSSAIDKILSTPVSLKNLSIEDWSFIKQKILKDLLLNSLNNIKVIEQKLSELNICLQSNNLMIFVLRIDSFKNLSLNYSKEDLELYLYALTNISLEITSAKYNCEAVDMDSDHISIILNIGEEPLSQATSAIINIIKHIQKTVLNSLHFSVTAGIGHYAGRLSELPKAYKWAYEYTNYKIKYGPNSILFYDKVISGIKENYKYPENKEKLLFDAIKTGKLDNIEVCLSDLLEELLNYDYMDMLFYIMQFSMNSQKLLNTLKNASDENFLINFEFFTENLEKFETINEIKNWLMSYYSRALNQLKDNKEHKKDKIVNKIISYVEQNYNNPNISPEYLADYAKISPNYLRTIFKESQNQSLSSFINEYRFGKAKILLQTTDLTINEISSRIGFTNTNYFYTCFKKYYGISPSEWRKNLVYNNNAQ